MPSKKNAKAKAATAVDVPAETAPATTEAKDVVAAMPSSPTEKKHRRSSSSVTDVLKPDELSECWHPPIDHPLHQLTDRSRGIPR